MSSVAVPEAFLPIASATALGVITFTEGTAGDLFPGALAWLCKDDGSARLRVMILSAVYKTGSADTITVRAYDDRPASDRSLNAATRAPSYGRTSVSAFNASSHLSQEIQTAPIDRSFSKRNFG